MQDPLVRFISLFTDYLALFLLLGVAISGMLMRYVVRADITTLKQFALSLAAFHPVVPAALGTVFLVHLLLVSTLAAYFPFSKLVHMGGVFLSPTRNLANNNRRYVTSTPGTIRSRHTLTRSGKRSSGTRSKPLDSRLRLKMSEKLTAD